MIEPMRDGPELSVVMVVGEERDRGLPRAAAVRAQAATRPSSSWWSISRLEASRSCRPTATSR
jgi:hypothetical protein